MSVTEDNPFSDLIVEVVDHVATVTINRPPMNALRAQTYLELIEAIQTAGWDRDIGVIVITGAGGRAFGAGGDAKEKKSDLVGSGRGTVGKAVEELWTVMRDVPKPIIAKVRGHAVGASNVMVTICDLAIASDTAIFGQVGPRVGSVDPGFGTAGLARVIGEKRAREMWYLCKQYSAQEALAMGLVNRVVPDDRLDAEVDDWCSQIVAKSPTALAIAKRSFNADTEAIRGSGMMGFQAVALYFGTDEAKEGGAAFREKRTPDFFKARSGAHGTT